MIFSRPLFPMKTLPLLALPWLALTARAAVIITSGSLNTPIPDDTDTGLVHSLNVPDSFIVGSVSVSLNLSVPGGDYGWTGDLYAYLQHGNGLSVLLNRPGRTDGSTAAGYGDNQTLTVSFTDGAANGDIHNYRLNVTGSDVIPLTGPLTGAWQPDGRATDPALTLTADPRTALLGQFNGLDSAGTWTLFLADLSGGSRFQLDSWGVELSAFTPVPEPETVGCVVGVALLGFAAWGRLRQWSNRPHVSTIARLDSGE